MSVYVCKSQLPSYFLYFFSQTPKTRAEWLTTAHGFQNRWQYPCCLGAVDGKHVEIVKPPNSGTLYYNYKDFFSVVLLVVANGNYEILFVDVGSEGRLSDGGIWKKSTFFKMLRDDKLDLPPPRDLNGHDMPYHLVGDDAFALDTHMMKPFSKKGLTPAEDIFNYRLSRARRVVENVFGILASRFQVLQSAIRGSVRHTNYIVLACATLHNLLRREAGRVYLGQDTVDMEDVNGDINAGEWRGVGELVPMRCTTTKNPTQVAKDQRERLMAYFSTPEGEVAWQYDRHRRQLARELSRTNKDN